MKAVVICVALILSGCRGPMSADEIRRSGDEQYRESMSKIDTGSRGLPHPFDVAGFCELCGKDEDGCASCEACPVASEGWTSEQAR